MITFVFLHVDDLRNAKCFICNKHLYTIANILLYYNICIYLLNPVNCGSRTISTLSTSTKRLSLLNNDYSDSEFLRYRRKKALDPVWVKKDAKSTKTWLKGVIKSDGSFILTSCKRYICNNQYIARWHDFYRDMISHRVKIWFQLRIKIVFYLIYISVDKECIYYTT